MRWEEKRAAVGHNNKYLTNLWFPFSVTLIPSYVQFTCLHISFSYDTWCLFFLHPPITFPAIGFLKYLRLKLM